MTLGISRSISINTRHRIYSFSTFLFESYKVIMGTLFVLFVPHQCNRENGDAYICSLNDNIMRFDEPIDYIVKISNVISLMILCYFYFYELKRENFYIKYFDLEEHKPLNHLDKEIDEFPIIKNKLYNYNKKFLKTIYICSISYLANIIISIFDLVNHYAGFTTITAASSYTTLVCVKLYMSYDSARQSVQHERAVSSYLIEPVTFNTIDRKYKLENGIRSRRRIETDNTISSFTTKFGMEPTHLVEQVENGLVTYSAQQVPNEVVVTIGDYHLKIELDRTTSDNERAKIDSNSSESDTSQSSKDEDDRV
jgi:hypothetical protein